MTYSYHNLAQDLRSGRYTSVGGYPVFFYGDGVTLCFCCVKKDLLTHGRAIRKGEPDRILGSSVNWEGEHVCEECGEDIERAYK